MTPQESNANIFLVGSTPELTPTLLSEIKRAFGIKAQIADSLDAVANSTSQVVVITSPPARVLATYLQAGTNPEAALLKWSKWAQDLLNLQRKNRRNISLVDIDLLLRGNPVDIGRLTTRLGGSFTRLPAPPSIQRPSAIQQVLAAKTIAADPAAAELAEEIGSVQFYESQPFYAIELSGNVASELSNLDKQMAVLQEKVNLQRREIERLERTSSNTQQENTQSSLMRKTITLQSREIDRLARTIAGYKAKVVRITEAFNRARNATSDLRKNVKLRDAKIRTLTFVLAKRSREAKKFKQRLNKLRKSFSWRITAPIRFIGRMFTSMRKAIFR